MNKGMECVGFLKKRWGRSWLKWKTDHACCEPGFKNKYMKME